jgi:aldose 1-epimerase
MAERLVLETAEAVVEIVPRLGGSLSAFDLKVGADHVPILRRWTGEWENPRALASSPMVPWFNRIPGGGFTFSGKFYPIARNDPLDEFPIHGDGWLSPWEVTAHDSTRVTLRLRSRAIPPFDYEATQEIALAGATLEMALMVKHLGAEPLPYGLGQHPWFVRTPATRLHAPAAGTWLPQPPQFPATMRTDPIPEKWDFSRPHALPLDLIDNGFAGWNGRARIDWPDRGVAVDVEADSGARFYQIYSPDAQAPFFCFEPVTHPNGALAMPEPPEKTGLRVLRRDEETNLLVRFTGSRIKP